MSGLSCASGGNAVGANGLPERIALHFVRVQGDVSPPSGALELIGALEGKRLRGLGGLSLEAALAVAGDQLAGGLGRRKAALSQAR